MLEEEPKKQYPDYFNAIKKSPKKVALLQHLITDVSNPENQSPSMYLWFSTIQNALKIDKEDPQYSNWRLIQEGFIPSLNQDFNHVFNSIYDGKPIFGACDGCIEFYAGRNYETCRRILDKTMKDRHTWYYSLFD